MAELQHQLWVRLGDSGAKDRELALARLEAEVLALRDRYLFLEKALEQAVRHINRNRNPRHPLTLNIAGDEDELAQYLKEKDQ